MFSTFIFLNLLNSEEICISRRKISFKPIINLISMKLSFREVIDIYKTLPESLLTQIQVEHG